MPPGQARSKFPSGMTGHHRGGCWKIQMFYFTDQTRKKIYFMLERMRNQSILLNKLCDQSGK